MFALTRESAPSDLVAEGPLQRLAQQRVLGLLQLGVARDDRLGPRARALQQLRVLAAGTPLELAQPRLAGPHQLALARAAPGRSPRAGSRRCAPPSRAAAARRGGPDEQAAWSDARRGRPGPAAGAAARARSARRSRPASPSRSPRRSPTSITVVATSTSALPDANLRHRLLLLAPGACCPCSNSSSIPLQLALRQALVLGASPPALASPPTPAPRRPTVPVPAAGEPGSTGSACLDQRAHDVTPACPRCSCSRSCSYARARCALARDDPRLDRLPSARQLAQDAHVEVPVARQRQRARDRRGGHVQHVRRRALPPAASPGTSPAAVVAPFRPAPRAGVRRSGAARRPRATASARKRTSGSISACVPTISASSPLSSLPSDVRAGGVRASSRSAARYL